jgi:hypothetical protein
MAPNPPVGAYIDYYLSGAAQTPVKIDIIGPLGNIVRSYSSADKIEPVDASQEDVAPVWFPHPLVVPTDAGAHRFVWDFTTRHDGGPLAPPGVYKVRLSVNGTAQTRSFALVRDPRIDVTDKALWSQYQFANAAEDALGRIKAAAAHAKELLASPNVSDANKQILKTQILGGPQDDNPDNSVGYPETRFSTLYALGNAIGALEGAVESADAAPTSDQTTGLAKLRGMLDETVAKIAGIAGPK